MPDVLFAFSSSLHVPLVIYCTEKLIVGKKYLRVQGGISQLFFHGKSPKIFFVFRETFTHEKVDIPEKLKSSERDSITVINYYLEYLFGKNAREMPVEVKLFSFGSGTLVFKVLGG